MAEDSGAFKTNPRNSAQIGRFVIAREAATKMPHGSKNADYRSIAAFGREFCNEQVRDVAISSIRPDSPVGIRPSFCGHRVPFGINSPA
jgi:hypothetical protein